MRKLTKEFVTKAKTIHGDLYEYDDFIYSGALIKGIIKCKIHGAFKQSPDNHCHKNGCPKCVGKNITTEEFITKAKNIHNEIYEYCLVDYKGRHKKVKITCKIHGVFEQTPCNHIHKTNPTGCPKCSRHISKAETEWLDSLNVPLRQHSIKTIQRKINVDGYNPETNTAYQFHGDYWHGNPQIYTVSVWNERKKCFMNELYKQTIKNDEMIMKSGYNLITMWENDYKRKMLNE